MTWKDMIRGLRGMLGGREGKCAEAGSGGNDGKEGRPGDSKPAVGELPHFKYHPDPIATGSIEAFDGTCPCCGKRRGYAYVLTPYCEAEVEHLCPWCIADGSAAKKYDAEFVDADPLCRAGIDAAVVDEVVQRTPGFASLQQEEWLACCKDACEFHGDVSAEELAGLPAKSLAELRRKYELDKESFEGIIEDYEPGGSPAIYKFKCRHCGSIRLGMDFD